MPSASLPTTSRPGVTPDTLADLGHGGLLGKEMRFRFPDYARDLDSPP